MENTMFVISDFLKWEYSKIERREGISFINSQGTLSKILISIIDKRKMVVDRFALTNNRHTKQMNLCMNEWVNKHKKFKKYPL